MPQTPLHPSALVSWLVGSRRRFLGALLLAAAPAWAALPPRSACDGEFQALLRAAPAVGAVGMALVLARWPPRRRVGRVLLRAVAVFALATVGFGLSTSLPLSLGLLVVLGAADEVSVMLRQTLVQVHTPD